MLHGLFTILSLKLVVIILFYSIRYIQNWPIFLEIHIFMIQFLHT